MLFFLYYTALVVTFFQPSKLVFAAPVLTPSATSRESSPDTSPSHHSHTKLLTSSPPMQYNYSEEYANDQNMDSIFDKKLEDYPQPSRYSSTNPLYNSISSHDRKNWPSLVRQQHHHPDLHSLIHQDTSQSHFFDPIDRSNQIIEASSSSSRLESNFWKNLSSEDQNEFTGYLGHYSRSDIRIPRSHVRSFCQAIANRELLNLVLSKDFDGFCTMVKEVIDDYFGVKHY